MLKVSNVVIARPVKIVVNTNNNQSHQWGQIKDAITNEVLATGQLSYIRKKALKKYNVRVIV